MDARPGGPVAKTVSPARKSLCENSKIEPRIGPRPGGPLAKTSAQTSGACVWFSLFVLMYSGTLVQMTGPIEVERIQTGVRMEKRLLKVLKAVAELKDMTLGDLLEGIVLHAFEGKSAFSPQTLKEIEQFRSIYGLTLHASDSHRLKERK
jgi:hypothetical protein